MKVDPAELEVFKNLFHSVAEEMGAALRRSAFSPNIKERRDYSCAVFDGQGRAVAMGDHMPVHLGSMPMSVAAAIQRLDLGPGDIAMLNDPYSGGTHLPDITLVMPVMARAYEGAKKTAALPPAVRKGLAFPAPQARQEGNNRTPRLGRLPISRRLSAQQAAEPQQPVTTGRARSFQNCYPSGPSLAGRQPPLFYVANRAHHSDIGGGRPASMGLSEEIYQEGLRIPPVVLARGGKVQRDILAMRMANVRTPREREGDLLAQVAACRLGERRLGELVQKYGVCKTTFYLEALQGYSAQLMREALSRIPDGTYRAKDFLDDDGFSRRPVRLQVAIHIRGHCATVDFGGTSAACRGSVNAVLAITTSAVFYVFRCLLGEDVPACAGLMEPIEVRAPKGTVVNAQAPAAVAAGNVETSQRIVDVFLRALAPALPDRIPAASSGTMNNLSFGGLDPLSGEPFAYYETIAGGMGARPDADGLSGAHTHMTNSLNTPIEALESSYPVRVRLYSLRRSSGGAGRYRGGEGLIREIEFLTDVRGSILSDRRVFPPYGLAGGRPGRTGRTELHVVGRVAKLPSKSVFSAPAGSVLRVETPGGGGWGKK